MKLGGNMKARKYFALLTVLLLLFPTLIFAQPLDEALKLNQQGLEAHRNGRYQEALSYYQKSLNIFKEFNNQQNMAVVMSNIGLAYFSLHQYEKALPYFEESLKISKDLGNLGNQQLISFNSGIIATLYALLGQPEKLIPYMEDSAPFWEQILASFKTKGDQQNTAQFLYILGGSYLLIGEEEKALSYSEEALKIFRRINNRKKIVECLDLLGTVYLTTIKFEEARDCHEEALKIAEELNNQEYIAKSLSSIGQFYGSGYAGQFDKALSYQEKALEIRRKLNIQKDIAHSLERMGNVYERLGQYDKALACFEEALKIDQELNTSFQIAQNMLKLGSVYASLGQYDKALYYFEDALRIGKNLNISILKRRCLSEITGVYAALGQYDKALSYLEETLKIAKMLPIEKAVYLNNIGEIYTLQKRYVEAEKILLEVEEIRKNTKGHRIKGLPGLLELYLATGRYDEMILYLKDMEPEWNSDDPQRIRFHRQYGLALKGKGMLQKASYELHNAVSITENMRGRTREKTEFFAEYSGYRIRPYKALSATLAERVLNGEMKNDVFSPYGKDLASAAFYFSESTKARTLLEEMVESARRYTKAELPEDMRKKEGDILNQLSVIEDQWEAIYKKGEEPLKALLERKEKLKKELDVLISEMRKKFPRYAALNYPKPIPPEELPLNENEILLEYTIYDDATYLFKVTKGKVDKIFKIPKKKEEIERLVNEFVLLLKDPYTKKDSSASFGKNLYALLLEQALKDISEDKYIIIVPDGVLGLLPFEALVVKGGEHIQDKIYVGDIYRITYSQSATVLALNRLLKPSEAKKYLFALGNPIYSTGDERYIAYKRGVFKPDMFQSIKNKDKATFRALTTRKEWGKTTRDDKEGKELEFPPLPETETEVKTIARFFETLPEPPDILLNIFANESNFRKVPLKEYRYLHFATHADLGGMVQGIKEPFLLLGQVENNPGDDGFLTLTKVLDLNLDADMVVLSACLTGRGKAMEGEGVMNFARAFQHAGARSVVTSLWEVVSKETVEFMTIFYRNLKEGKSKGESLQHARTEMKNKYLNPFFWAPFILYGER
jgi:CHAT domain-containing protein/Tfp pilus assembly protein PilF